MTESNSPAAPWQEALEADQRRVRRWVWFAAIMGGAAAVVISGILVVAWMYLPVEEYSRRRLGMSSPPSLYMTQDLDVDPKKVVGFTIGYAWLATRALILLSIAVALLLIANVGMMFVVLMSRRATLKHVNAGLQDLSAQLASVQKLLERSE